MTFSHECFTCDGTGLEKCFSLNHSKGLVCFVCGDSGQLECRCCDGSGEIDERYGHQSCDCRDSHYDALRKMRQEEAR